MEKMNNIEDVIKEIQPDLEDMFNGKRKITVSKTEEGLKVLLGLEPLNITESLLEKLELFLNTIYLIDERQKGIDNSGTGEVRDSD